jgi:hypothetical protein
MRLKNGTAVGKSHAAGRGIIERVQALINYLSLNTYPRIFNRYLHLVGIDISRGDHQSSRPVSYAAHRFDGVHHQIQHRLLHLHLTA